MLEWGSPWWLLALPLAVALPWLARAPRMTWSSLEEVVTRRTWRVALAWLPAALGSVALVLLVCAMARPQLVDRERVVEREGIDILLILDVSGSMEQADYTLSGRRATRLDVAKRTISEFVEGRPDDRIGLVVFGEEAFTQVPLTLDHEALTGFIDQVQIGMAGQRATAVGDAVAVAARRLKELEAESRVAILLTDGRNNAGQVAPLQAAEAAHALGIRVYTIGVGTEGGRRGIFGMMGGGGDLDERTLQAIAKITDARYFRATSTTALEEVYATIDELEKTTAEAREFVHRQERYPPLLAWGLALLGVQALLAETVLRRLP